MTKNQIKINIFKNVRKLVVGISLNRPMDLNYIFATYTRASHQNLQFKQNCLRDFFFTEDLNSIPSKYLQYEFYHKNQIPLESQEIFFVKTIEKVDGQHMQHNIIKGGGYSLS